MNINNMLSLNAQSQMRMNQLQLQQSLMKLSSGYRINSAADDAAGLAISESMRAQATGMQQAMRNTQDASSVVGVADGALSTMNSMLNRLTELSVQAGNGILSDEQRASINNEAQQLLGEIDRISEATNFNGQKLLDGSLATSNTLAVSGVNSQEIADSVYIDGGDLTVFDGSNSAAASFSIAGQEFMLAQAGDMSAAAAANPNATLIEVSGSALNATDYSNIAGAVTAQTGTQFTASGTGFSAEVGKGLEMQVGDTGAPYNTVSVDVGNMSSAGLGLSGLDLTTSAGASKALNSIRNAINSVNTVRGNLGATENRLDHTYNSLAVSRENSVAAESRIRDADMAKTLMDFTRRNILTQTGMAMQSHSQLNTMQVLNLLR